MFSNSNGRRLWRRGRGNVGEEMERLYNNTNYIKYLLKRKGRSSRSKMFFIINIIVLRYNIIMLISNHNYIHIMYVSQVFEHVVCSH